MSAGEYLVSTWHVTRGLNSRRSRKMSATRIRLVLVLDLRWPVTRVSCSCLNETRRRIVYHCGVSLPMVNNHETKQKSQGRGTWRPYRRGIHFPASTQMVHREDCRTFCSRRSNHRIQARAQDPHGLGSRKWQGAPLISWRGAPCSREYLRWYRLLNVLTGKQFLIFLSFEGGCYWNTIRSLK